MNNETARQARFSALAEAYGTDLYRYAMWICGNDALAKDLVQETYLRAWRALDKLNDERAAKSWLITILRREYARTFERKVPKFTDVDTVEVPEDAGMDLAVWRIPASDSGITAGLEKPLVIETQPLSLWNSQTGYRVAADIYRYLVHGHVYVDRFIWPRMSSMLS